MCSFYLLDENLSEGCKKSAPTISETLLKYLQINANFVGLWDNYCNMMYYNVPLQKNLLDICWTFGSLLYRKSIFYSIILCTFWVISPEIIYVFSRSFPRFSRYIERLPSHSRTVQSECFSRRPELPGNWLSWRCSRRLTQEWSALPP